MGGAADFQGILVGARTEDDCNYYVAVQIVHLPDNTDFDRLITAPTSVKRQLDHLMTEIAKTYWFKSYALAPGKTFTLVNFPYELAQTSSEPPIRIRPLSQNEMSDLVQRCSETIKKGIPSAQADYLKV